MAWIKLGSHRINTDQIVMIKETEPGKVRIVTTGQDVFWTDQHVAVTTSAQIRLEGEEAVEFLSAFDKLIVRLSGTFGAGVGLG